MKLLGLSGSLRLCSLNQIALHTLDSLGYPIDVYDYGDVPLYDPDAKTRPAAVDRLVAAIDSADAVIIATPEYNYSIPGVLKNALDWAKVAPHIRAHLGVSLLPCCQQPHRPSAVFERSSI